MVYLPVAKETISESLATMTLSIVSAGTVTESKLVKNAVAPFWISSFPLRLEASGRIQTASSVKTDAAAAAYCCERAAMRVTLSTTPAYRMEVVLSEGVLLVWKSGWSGRVVVWEGERCVTMRSRNGSAGHGSGVVVFEYYATLVSQHKTRGLVEASRPTR